MKHTLTILIMLITLTGFSTTVYIDPSKHTAGENGTKAKPFDSWQDVELTNGNTYLQKAGTTYTSSVQIWVKQHSVKIGSYGTGSRPIFSYTGSGYAFRVSASFCTIENFEVNGNLTAFALVGVQGSTGEYWQNVTINNCLLTNAHNQNNGGFGIHAAYTRKLSILNTEIRNVALDGIYAAYSPMIEIGYCLVIDINRRYFSNADQVYSSGDGIQLDGYYNGFKIHHTTVDRTNGAGNKFNVILASKVGISNKATGIIEHCTFRTGANVSTAVQVEMGRGIIIRYNKFKGSTQGLRLGGGYTSGNLIYGNEFSGCTSGVGVGFKYPNIGPATGTKIYDNSFKSISLYRIWTDKAIVETCNNESDGTGVPEYNYGGGTFKTIANCNQY